MPELDTNSSDSNSVPDARSPRRALRMSILTTVPATLLLWWGLGARVAAPVESWGGLGLVCLALLTMLYMASRPRPVVPTHDEEG